MIRDVIALRDGLPIFTHTLNLQEGICKDEDRFTLISGFLQAITSFANTLEHLGDVDELQMTGLIFTFKKMQYANTELLFIISSKQTNQKFLRKLILEQIAENFIDIYAEQLQKEWNGDVKPYREFKKLLTPLMMQLVQEYSEEDWKHDLSILNPQKEKIYKMPEDRFLKYKQSKLELAKMQKMQKHPSNTNFQDQLNAFSQKTPSHIYQTLTQLQTQGNSYINQKLYVPPVPKRNFEKNPNLFEDQAFNQNLEQDLQKFKHPLQENYQKLKQARKNVFDLIPRRKLLKAKDLQRKFESKWIPVIMVCIDGRKSLNNIAELLEIPVNEVLLLCQHLKKEGLIMF